MSEIILYAGIGAGIALVLFILFKLFSGREKKSKAYPFQKGEQPFAQATELYDSSIETKKHIRSAALNISMISEIVPMLEANDKIEAIKYVQEKEQMNLHDAKAFVDEAEKILQKLPGMFHVHVNGQNENQTFQNELSQLDKEIKALIERDNMIAAIKIYREQTNTSLADAKEYCEEFARRNNLMK